MDPPSGQQDLMGTRLYDDGTVANFTITNNLSLPYLTASKFMATDSSQNVISSSLTGTANQVAITGQGTATCTLSLPQDIATISSPTFAGLNINTLLSVLGNKVVTWDSTTKAVSYADASASNLNNSVVLRDGTGASSFGALSITGFITNSSLNASQPVKSNASKQLVSSPIDLITDITNILGVANGGTNSATALANNFIMSSQAGAIKESTTQINVDTITQPNTNNRGWVIGNCGTASTAGLANANLALNPGNMALTQDSIGNTTINAVAVLACKVAGSTFQFINTTGINFPLVTPTRPLKVNGTNFLTSGLIDLTSASDVTGILPIASGGTASSTALTNGKLMASVGGAIVEGTSSTSPSFTNLTLSGDLTTASLSAISPAYALTQTSASNIVRKTTVSQAASSLAIPQFNLLGNLNANAMSLNNTSGQITLGPAATATIVSATTPVATQTVTIPDAGTTTSNFVLTELAQTINGAKTLSAVTTVSNTTDASSSSTGAVTTAGGMSCQKKCYVGTTLNVGGLTASKLLATDASKNLISVGFPTRATMWAHEGQPHTSGGYSIINKDTSESYCQLSSINGTANDGDYVSWTCLLAAGTYTLSVLGMTQNNFGKYDWSCDGSNVITGDDRYSAAATYNVVATSGSFTVTGNGRHLFKGTVNGKNAASTGRFLNLTCLWVVPTATDAADAN